VHSHITLGTMNDQSNDVTIKGHGFHRLEDGRSGETSSKGVYVATEVNVDSSTFGA
jgi:hypothetical protein